MTNPTTAAAEPLAYFNHHPDPSTDYCCEVDMLEGWAYEVKVGLRSQWPFWGRLSAALAHQPVQDEYTVKAREILTKIERSVTHA